MNILSCSNISLIIFCSLMFYLSGNTKRDKKYLGKFCNKKLMLELMDTGPNSYNVLHHFICAHSKYTFILHEELITFFFLAEKTE